MLANDTEYGLAAYFYTRDLRRAWHIAEQLEYGMVRHTASHSSHNHTLSHPLQAAAPTQMQFVAAVLGATATVLRAS